MNHLESMRVEFTAEAACTKKLLDRIPADKLTWKPHARSMSLGQLALHIATVPGSIVRITKPDVFDASQNNFNPPGPASLDEVHAAFNQGVRDVDNLLRETTDEIAHAPWQLMFGDRPMMSIPRIDAWRTLMLNHWYHHRGQLSVYLRLLDIPVPSIYGPSADDQPFA
jgi:uncharacterized damage-inducible protein DinB